MGTLRDIIEPKGAIIVGHWPTAGYNFVASKALVDDNHFVGLGVDEDRQPNRLSKELNSGVSKFTKR
ncbi:Flavodoxin 1 [Alishewanella longhuensis]